MNCRKVQKYLFAFADGQLGVKANCEMLDHLKMCRKCSAIVDEHQAIRQAIQFGAEKLDIPDGLETRVRKAIQIGKPFHPRTAGRRRLFSPGLRIVAAAACLGLAVFAGWRFGSSQAPVGVRAASTPDPEFEKVADVAAAQHSACGAKCDLGLHHNDILPHEREFVAPAIRDHFDGRLAALVPNLSDHAFQFESANFCCVTGEDPCISGHVMYVNSQKTRLSLFSMPRWKAIDEIANGAQIDRNHRLLRVRPHQGRDIAVVAWHDQESTYICCAEMEPSEMKEITREIALAMKDPVRREMFAAAFGSRQP